MAGRPTRLMLVIILAHRISLILTVILSAALPLLPYIFNQKGDEEFITKTTNVIQRLVWLGLAMLVLSGVIRLQLEVPQLIGAKFAIAGLLLCWEVYGYRSVDQNKYQIVQLLMVLVTAVTGLFVALQ